jgi:hypothetical protein
MAVAQPELPFFVPASAELSTLQATWLDALTSPK